MSLKPFQFILEFSSLLSKLRIKHHLVNALCSIQRCLFRLEHKLTLLHRLLRIDSSIFQLALQASISIILNALELLLRRELFSRQVSIELILLTLVSLLLSLIVEVHSLTEDRHSSIDVSCLRSTSRKAGVQQPARACGCKPLRCSIPHVRTI